jgi:DNA helicase HerA-like ATPase
MNQLSEMKANVQTDSSTKKPTDKEELGFHVGDFWPLDRIPADMQQEAVKQLIVNHTLIVGQSRSGKTNAARLLIEEILRWTEARIVILDPNADFKMLKAVHPELKLKISENEELSDKEKKEISRNAEFASDWPQLGERIEIAAPGKEAWGIRWGNLSLEEMAAYLQLSPTTAFEEYRQLDRHLKYEKQMLDRLESQTKEQKGKGLDTRLGTIDEFKASGYFDLAVGEDVERYRLRLERLSKKDVWWKGGETKDLDSLFDENYKAIVVDLSKDDEQERMITAARALQALWGQGESGRKKLLQSSAESWRGTVVVIDEAHMFAPPKLEDPQKQLLGERIQRFADQGKKFNLYLMLITQQPGKLHPNVLAECNNRIVLRVNERRSLSALEETYGGLRGRYNGALTFEPGEALFEGALLCDESPPPAVPRGVQFKKARTKEGGGTPDTAWAMPRTRKQKATT